MKPTCPSSPSGINRLRLCAVCLAAIFPVAFVAASSSAQPGALAAQIAQHEQNLAQARSSKNVRQQVSEFNYLGALYYSAGQLEKALDYLNQALPIEQKYSSLLGQATTLNTMGRVYTDLGQEDKALTLLNQALPLWRALPSRAGEADTLNNIGKVYNNLGQHDDALKYLNQSLAIWHEVNAPPAAAPPVATSPAAPSAGNAPSSPAPAQTASASSFLATASINGEASTLDNLGRTWSDMGDGQKALDYFNQALPLFRNLGERNGEALLLNDTGPAYAALGQKQKALDVYNQAIALWRKLGNRQGEALTINNIGRLYNDLGEHQTALDYYNQALPIWREVGNRSGEALALSDIGRAYADLGQPAKALDFQTQALPIFRDVGSRRGEAMVLNNLGRDRSDLGEAQKAYDLDLQALVIWREVKDQRDEAQDLMTIAWAYSDLKQPELSFASAIAALGLAKATGDPQIEGNIENSLMIGFRKQHQPEEAIFFGLLAVNDYEQIRKNILGMEKEVQAGFAQSRSGAYRMLAELLVETGRLGQAEQILDLLKEQELQDVVTTAAPGASAGIEPLKLSPAQQDAESALPDLEKKARVIEESSLAYGQLQAKPSRTPDEDAQLKSLGATIQQEGSDIQSVLTNRIFPELDAQSSPGQASGDASKSFLQDSLSKLGPRVMGIRLLLGDDHAYAIVVTAASRKVVVLPASSADIRAKALEALKAVGSPSSDPRPQLNQLYSMVVAPIEAQLKSLESAPSPNSSPKGSPSGSGKGSVPTLLWSLDDALRYVPIGALYDGTHYMVERFHNVLFTPESYGHITDSPLQSGTSPSALAMGLSKSYNGLPALPGVIPELDSVVHDPSDPASHGPMQGKLLPDEQFTLANLKSDLGAGNNFSVVHIASHFVLIAGSGDEPFLMMGGDNTGDPSGFEWNLSAMENSDVAFHGTRLLTLSACSTAKDYKSRNGLEMDSLGMVAQQKDAEAVLATLWDVNDLSTSHIMSDFYDRWVRNPSDGKAEALRQAQLAFIHGGGAVPGGGSGRGFETEDQASPPSSLGYAHPYYWAPFVLIGNYQ
ncbi:MAG: tetratricopeptide repeat protein [Terracidiphilus sp.]